MKKRMFYDALQCSLRLSCVLLMWSLLLGHETLHAAEQTPSSSPCTRTKTPQPLDESLQQLLVVITQAMRVESIDSSGLFDWEDMPDHPQINGSGGCSPVNP